MTARARTSEVAAGRSTRRADRIATGTSRACRSSRSGIVCWQVWADLLRWSDVAVFVIMYVLTGLGVTVGFHRHLTHRSFKTKPLAARPARDLRLGGDRGPGHLVGRRPPQAPHLLRPGGRPAQPARRPRRRLARRAAAASSTRTSAGCSSTPSAAPGSATRRDLIEDPVSRSSTGPSCSGRSAGSPSRSGSATRSAARCRGGLTGLLWGGARADARGPPRHLQHQLALPLLRRASASRPRTSRATCSGWRCSTFGESWHNNHHAFPTSAFHGLRRWEIDPSALRDQGAREARARLGRGADQPERQARKAAAA